MSNREKYWNEYGLCSNCYTGIRACASAFQDKTSELFCPVINCVNNAGSHINFHDEWPDWVIKTPRPLPRNETCRNTAGPLDRDICDCSICLYEISIKSKGITPEKYKEAIQTLHSFIEGAADSNYRKSLALNALLILLQR